jgi:hypothetical protein
VQHAIIVDSQRWRGTALGQTAPHTMKKTKRPLHLNKETIRELAPAEVVNVAGASGELPCTAYCKSIVVGCGTPNCPY